MRRVFALALLLWPLLAWPAADPAKGAALHKSCLQCHGTEAYLPPQRKIASLSALRRETARWADYYNPKLTKSEIDDVVAYLNRDFYRFR